MTPTSEVTLHHRVNKCDGYVGVYLVVLLERPFSSSPTQARERKKCSYKLAFAITLYVAFAAFFELSTGNTLRTTTCWLPRSAL